MEVKNTQESVRIALCDNWWPKLLSFEHFNSVHDCTENVKFISFVKIIVIFKIILVKASIILPILLRNLQIKCEIIFYFWKPSPFLVGLILLAWREEYAWSPLAIAIEVNNRHHLVFWTDFNKFISDECWTALADIFIFCSNNYLLGIFIVGKRRISRGVRWISLCWTVSFQIMFLYFRKLLNCDQSSISYKAVFQTNQIFV